VRQERQSTARPLTVIPAASAAARPSAMEGPFQLLALSAEKSITLRKPFSALVSIISTPFSSAAPMALRPKARRGAAMRRSAKEAALSGPSITVQSTTTSCDHSLAHST
jgi:hypothetical protein